jgi:hypothetical protein
MSQGSRELLGGVGLLAVGAFGVVLNLTTQGPHWPLLTACAAVMFLSGAFLLFIHLKGRRGK